MNFKIQYKQDVSGNITPVFCDNFYQMVLSEKMVILLYSTNETVLEMNKGETLADVFLKIFDEYGHETAESFIRSAPQWIQKKFEKRALQ